MRSISAAAACSLCLAIAACGSGAPPADRTGTAQQDSTASGRLWVAVDSGFVDTSFLQSFYQCLLHQTSYNDTFINSYADGVQLVLGGVRTISHCSTVVHQSWCGTSDTKTMQCIINQTSWPVTTNDVILYYPSSALAGSGSGCTSYSGGCYDGRNQHGIVVTSSKGTATIRAAYSFSGSTAAGKQYCQTALGMHEVFEAATAADAADCCNGQGSCKGHEPNAPYGWYTFNGCGTSYNLQRIATAANKWNPAGCTTVANFCNGEVCSANGACCTGGTFCSAAGHCCDGTCNIFGCPC
jgi:hypothetical protein